MILLDSGEAAGVICDTKVTLVPFDEHGLCVLEEFALLYPAIAK